jgi:hypothetical protein
MAILIVRKGTELRSHYLPGTPSFTRLFCPRVPWRYSLRHNVYYLPARIILHTSLLACGGSLLKKVNYSFRSILTRLEEKSPAQELNTLISLHEICCGGRRYESRLRLQPCEADLETERHRIEPSSACALETGGCKGYQIAV